MDAMKLIITLCLIGLLSCGTDTGVTAPWEGLSWLNKESAKIIVHNVHTKSRILKITYYNKTTAEEIIKEFDLKTGETDSLVFDIFRPEIIRFEFDETKYFTFIIPTLDMEIEISDYVKNVGSHSDNYTYLRKFGGHEIPNDFHKLAEENHDKVPEDFPLWLGEHLEKSEFLKSLYRSYSRGWSKGMKVEDYVHIQSDSITMDYDDGLYHIYYPLLLGFRSNYEIESTSSVMKEENYKYELLRYRTDQLMQIKNDDARYDLLAMSAEKLIRKRNTYSGKNEILAEIIDYLPSEYVDKLNEIKEENTKNGYDQSEVNDLLGQPMASLEGEAFPLSTAVGFKLLKFWFAGCAPCKREIPYEQKLLAQNPNTTLLSFCNKTPEKIWRSYINENSLEGHHFFLNQNDYNTFQEVFELSASPRYVLLDKSNKVVCWNCPNPSDPALAKFLK